MCGTSISFSDAHTKKKRTPCFLCFFVMLLLCYFCNKMTSSWHSHQCLHRSMSGDICYYCYSARFDRREEQIQEMFSLFDFVVNSLSHSSLHWSSFIHLPLTSPLFLSCPLSHITETSAPLTAQHLTPPPP